MKEMEAADAGARVAELLEREDGISESIKLPISRTAAFLAGLGGSMRRRLASEGVVKALCTLLCNESGNHQGLQKTCLRALNSLCFASTDLWQTVARQVGENLLQLCESESDRLASKAMSTLGNIISSCNELSSWEEPGPADVVAKAISSGSRGNTFLAATKAAKAMCEYPGTLTAILAEAKTFVTMAEAVMDTESHVETRKAVAKSLAACCEKSDAASRGALSTGLDEWCLNALFEKHDDEDGARPLEEALECLRSALNSESGRRKLAGELGARVADSVAQIVHQLQAAETEEHEGDCNIEGWERCRAVALGLAHEAAAANDDARRNLQQFNISEELCRDGLVAREASRLLARISNGCETQMAQSGAGECLRRAVQESSEGSAWCQHLFLVLPWQEVAPRKRPLPEEEPGHPPPRELPSWRSVPAGGFISAHE